MGARDVAEMLKDRYQSLVQDGDVEGTTHWGYGDADFFIDIEDEGRFLVSVVKVSE